MKFNSAADSHKHSLETLNQLLEYDDFMYSIKTVVDLGCGQGDDLEWWATRTTRDETQQPLNIECTGIDLAESFPLEKKHKNIKYQQCDFEGQIDTPKGGFDILWCHDSFQYALSPLQTLSNWWNITSPGGMLYIGVPVTQQIYRRQLDFQLSSGCYYNHTLVSLMYMLAATGWDCRSGFFKQSPNEPWIHAVVYRGNKKPLDAKTTSWYELSEQKLLPESTDRSIAAHGLLRQQDLVVQWIDHSLMSMAVK